jgi:hypothetical protein
MSVILQSSMYNSSSTHVTFLMEEERAIVKEMFCILDHQIGQVHALENM